MKKADVKAIKQLTGSMPPTVEVIPCKYVFTGEELMLGGYKDLIKQELYEVDGYAVQTINHEPKIKEAFKRKGIPGVKEYVEHVKLKYFSK